MSNGLGFSCVYFAGCAAKADDAVLLALASRSFVTREQSQNICRESSSLPRPARRRSYTAAHTPVLGQQQSVCLSADGQHQQIDTRREATNFTEDEQPTNLMVSWPILLVGFVL